MLSDKFDDIIITIEKIYWRRERKEEMKRWKRWIALSLAVCMIIPGNGGMMAENIGTVQAAEIMDDTEPVNDTDLVDDTTPVDNTDPADDTIPVDNTDSVEDTGIVEESQEPANEVQPVADTASELEAGLSVEARYSSNHIRWTAVTDATGYNVLRSDTADGEYSTLNSSALTTCDYVDETAGTDTQYFYKLEAIVGEETRTSAPVQDTYATGVEAVWAHAEDQMHYDFTTSEAGTGFDGTRMVTATTEEVDRVKALTEATVLLSFKPENVAGTTRESILNIKNSSTTTATATGSNSKNAANCVGFFKDGINGVRYDFGYGLRAAFKVLAAEGWTTFAMVNKTFTSGYNILHSGNGSRAPEVEGYGSANFNGFVSKLTGIDQITIGAALNGENTVVPFTGNIAYVTITDEVMSQAEIDGYTKAVTDMLNQADAPVTVEASVKASYDSVTVSWNMVKNADGYRVYRVLDGVETEVTTEKLGADVLSFQDTTVEKEKTYSYIVKAYSGETLLTASEAAADSAAVGMEALKAHAALSKEFADGDDQVFDGTRAVDVNESAEQVHKVDTGSIIIRFKAASDGTTGVLLETKDSAIASSSGMGTGADRTTIFLKDNNRNLRFVYKHTAAALAGPNPFTDGEWHMAIISCNPEGKYMRLTIDGVEVWSNTVASNKGMFAKQGKLDQVTIGAQKNADGTIANGFKGEISQVIVTDEILSDADAIEISREGYSGKERPGSAIAEMFNTAADNSWVFTGGSAVQGGYDQTEGIRNYIGQFEEYVRWTKSVTEYGRQRYTINMGKTGRTLKEIAANYETLVALYQPKAAAYMVGEEDYRQGEAGLNQFKADLKTFIDKSLALKENNGGFAVIQKPFASKEESDNALIQTYCEAVDSVVGTYAQDSAKYSHIVVVDHFSQTNNNDFKTNKLNADGKLNGKGHLEVGRQFSEATFGSSAGYPGTGVTLNLVKEEQAEQYLDVQPVITAGDTSLQVTIPEGNGTAWKYELDMDGTVVSGNAASNSFEISGLAQGKSYVLKLQSQDGQKQLVTMKGVIQAGSPAEKNVPVVDAKQQALLDKMESKDSMTWLFMGDSITHAALWTFGYDGIAQSFEKYLKDELGRTDDVVINTAVSGATTGSTLLTIDQRLKKYTPDVVSIMLGTNDAANNTDTASYKTNLETIIAEIKKINPEATIILRSPTPFWGYGVRDTNVLTCISEMQEVAEANNLIYVDQFTDVQEAITTYPWMKGTGTQFLFGNTLHPGVNGHLVMTRQFIRGCGLWTEDSPINNLFYQMPITSQDNTTVPELQNGASQIGLSVAKLKEASGLEIGQVILKATSKTSGQSYEISVKAGEEYAVLKNLPGNTTYDTEVSAYLKNEAKVVSFAAQEVTLTDDAVISFDVLLSNEKAKDLTVGAEVGTFRVGGMAPEGEYTYELCAGEGNRDNQKFTIEGETLKIKEALEEGSTYQIRVKAIGQEASAEAAFEIYAVGKGLIFEKSNMEITTGNPVDLTNEDYAEKLFGLTEGTIIVQYTSESDFIVQTLFSIANGTTGNNNRHAHVYIKPDGTLGCEIRNDSSLNYGFSAANAVKADYKGKAAKNTIALKADKENNEYKLFANGKLVKTVDAVALGGFKFADAVTGLDTVQIGATKRGGASQYTFAGTVHDIKVYETALSDEELIEATKVTEFKELQQIFHKEDGTGANYFRIPSLLTLKSGVVISAVDARFGGTHDSPNNIDIAVSRSDNGGKTWSAPELVFHYEDFADTALELPVGSGVRVNESASFIDPVMIQDEETGRVFLISDAMAAGYGSPQAVSGSGYKEIDGQKYLKLKKTGDTDYHYTVRENRVIYDDRTNTATEYSLNENFEILKNGELQTVKQKSSRYEPTGTTPAIVTDVTDKDVAMNIMYADAVFKALPTTWLYMKYSDDDGNTWSDPILLNDMVKSEESRILVVGPGRGTQIKNGEHKGRLIVPVYDNAKSGIIYSDDHGTTWNYAEGPNTSAAAMSETQIVEMPDGSLRVYARSNNSKIASAVSVDGGETWSAAEYVPGLTQPGWGSQLSVIRYGELVEGKPAIILSSPAGVGSYRKDGRIKIGLITDTGKTGVEKYDIQWKYDYSVDATNVGYAYSCLTELPNQNIGVLYEKYDSYNPAELQTQNAMKYEELSFSDLMGGDAARVTTAAVGNGKVSETNIVLAGSEVTIQAVPDENYEFVKWINADGETVSSEAEYTFTAEKDITLSAVFRDMTSEPELNKTALEERIAALKAVALSNMTTDSSKKFEALIAKAEEILANAQTQEELDAQLKALENAEELLEERGDVKELNSLVEEYQKLKKEDYPEAVWAAFEKVLNQAKEAAADNSNLNQSDVDAQEKALLAAFEELKKGSDKPTEEPKPDKPTEEPKPDKPAEEPKPDKPADSSEPSKSDTSEKQNNAATANTASNGNTTNTANAANTGDTANTAVYLFLMAAVSLGFVLLLMRKRSRKF